MLKIDELEKGISFAKLSSDDITTLICKLRAADRQGKLGSILQIRLAELYTKTGEWELALQSFNRCRDKVPDIHSNQSFRKAATYVYGIGESAGVLDNISLFDQFRSGNECNLVLGGVEYSFLFVSGMPRSGTTAIGKLLNISDEISLFVELGSEFYPASPYDFHPKILPRIVKFRNNETNKERLKGLKKTRWIGDKRPYFFMNMPHVYQNFAGREFKVIHVFRNIYDVCQSYQKRAANPKDIWHETKGIEQCIYEINLMLDYIVQLFETRSPLLKDLIFTDYASIFSCVDSALALFRTLGVQLSPDKVNEIQRFIDQSSVIAARPRVYSRDLVRVINESIDLSKVRSVEKATGCTLVS